MRARSEDRKQVPAVVCIGETMLMLCPPGHERLETSTQLTAHIGGSEANVAIGLERLGVHASWIGKLPNNALGRRISNEIRSYGVDTSSVIWADDGRLGLFFFERGAAPRSSITIYDRRGSAASTLTADDIDWRHVGQAKWLHLSGITLGLSDTCRAGACEIVTRARDLGLKVSFDANYRTLLCSRDQAREDWYRILSKVDLFITSEEDAAVLLQQPLERKEVLRRLLGEHGLQAIAMTLGEEGTIGYDGKDFYTAPAFPVTVVNRLGAGDAFAAGLLYGLLRSDIETGLHYGMAMAALKMTIPQNVPLVSREEVEQLLRGRQPALVR
jgi:2-dehydro-3-deoxygluconokinase